jgi:hypothetical protein
LHSLETIDPQAVVLDGRSECAGSTGVAVSPAKHELELTTKLGKLPVRQIRLNASLVDLQTKSRSF